VAKAVPVPLQLGFPFDQDGQNSAGRQRNTRREASNRMSILWIILIVILVLALLGFFSRGRW
jgi:flagellar basal body-associated protein FliL